MTRKRSWHSGKARLGPARVPRALAAGFLLALCAVLSAPPAQAVDAVVTWEADANPDLAGFRLHYGQASGSYQASVDVGAATTWTLAGLEDGAVYYIAVSAYDRFGQESSLSAEAVFAGASADGDGDGLADAIELLGCTSAQDADSDDDGIPDGVEDANHNGLADTGESGPCVTDTDADGLQDGTELGYLAASVGPDTNLAVFVADLDPATMTDPLDPDTDGDRLLDGSEDANRNGALDAGETDPLVADNPLLFADTFDIVSPGGDPDWRRVSGRWLVNRKRKYAASPTHSSLSVVESPHLSAFEAGRIETRVRLSAQGGRSPNASVLFHYLDRTAYRYVRITANGISVGQVGTTLGESAGVKQNLRMRLATNRWLRLRLDITPGGTLAVYLDGMLYPVLIHELPSVTPGQVGLKVVRAATQFDNVAVWDETVLP